MEHISLNFWAADQLPPFPHLCSLWPGHSRDRLGQGLSAQMSTPAREAACVLHAGVQACPSLTQTLLHLKFLG